MMEPVTFHNLPLGELVQVLKSRGFEVSIDQVLQLQSVLLSTDLRSERVSHLRYLVAPIMARNEEDQQEVYRIIDDYISSRTAAYSKPPSKIRMLLRNKKAMIVLKLSALLLVLVTALIFYFSQGRQNKPHLPAAETGVPVAGQPATPSQDTVPARPSEPGQPSEISGRFTYKIRSSSPIQPTAIDFNLQVSAIFGIILGIVLSYFLFYSSKKAMDPEKRKEQGGNDLFTLSPGDELAGSMQKNSMDFVEPLAPRFPDRSYLISRPSEFSRIRAQLKKLWVIERAEPDIDATIKATVRRAGFPSIVFGNETRERKFLVLAGAPHRDAPQLQLFHLLVRYLRATRVPVEEFYYSNDIHVLQDAAGKEYQLKELEEQLAGRHLIIYGEAGQLLRNPELSAGPWSSRSFISFRPMGDWQDEEKLEKAGFRVAPAEIEAIEWLVRSLVEDTPLRKERLAARIRDSYRCAIYDLHTLDGLRNYLEDEGLFQLACALAIYPWLDWSITLAIYAALKDTAVESPGAGLSYNHLLKLARIPWMQEKKPADDLRLDLLDALKPDTEVKAREALIRLLDEAIVKEPENSAVRKEFRVQQTISAFFLYAHDEYRFRKYSYARQYIGDHWNEMQDKALKQRTEGGQSGLMPMDSTGRRRDVEEFIVRDKELERRNITLSRVAALLLPALLMYILFSITRPLAIYPGDLFRPVTLRVSTQQDAACLQDSLRTVVEVNGKPRTGPEISDVRYNEQLSVSVWKNDSLVLSLPPLRAVDSFYFFEIGCR